MDMQYVVWKAFECCIGSIMDTNDMRYVNCMHAQTKFWIEHTSVGLAYAWPIMQGFMQGGTWEIPPPQILVTIL